MNRRKKKPGSLKSLSHGRPPYSRHIRQISSKATKKIISNYHTLHKQRAKALAIGDYEKALDVTNQIEYQGGIETYQQASLLGQSKERGGDSSKILLKWLKPLVLKLKHTSDKYRPLKMLEIGALSHSNACTTCKLFDVERIDLNSQDEGIKQQDFMKRSISQSVIDKFDIISLSLVLNFVPDAMERGKMLIRTSKFLRSPQLNENDDYFPCLFLVLPAPCILNSRYLNEARLTDIMQSIGFNCLKFKLTTKLSYSLWHLNSPNHMNLHPKEQESIGKQQLRTGSARNNFAILLPPTDTQFS